MVRALSVVPALHSHRASESKNSSTVSTCEHKHDTPFQRLGQAAEIHVPKRHVLPWHRCERRAFRNTGSRHMLVPNAKALMQVVRCPRHVRLQLYVVGCLGLKTVAGCLIKECGDLIKLWATTERATFHAFTISARNPSTLQPKPKH